MLWLLKSTEFLQPTLVLFRSLSCKHTHKLRPNSGPTSSKRKLHFSAIFGGGFGLLSRSLVDPCDDVFGLGKGISGIGVSRTETQAHSYCIRLSLNRASLFLSHCFIYSFTLRKVAMIFNRS